MFFNNQKGYSLSEVIVATGFVVIVATAGLTSMNYFRSLKNRSNTVCRLHVSSVVEKFRSIGYFAAVHNFTPLDANRSFYQGPSDMVTKNQVSLVSKGISDSDLWPNVNVLGAGNSPTLNNAVLISSSVNALLAIYNSNSNYCTTGAAYTGSAIASQITDLITAPSAELKNASLRIQIVPYNLTTGQDLPCIAPPLRIAPKPATGAGTFGGARPKATQDPNTRYDVGLRVRVLQEYTDEDNMSSACAVEQRFQYASDLTPPVRPNYSAMNRITGPATNNGCTSPSLSNSYTISFGFSGAGSEKLEAGGVFVCRDGSVTYNQASAANGDHAKVTCQAGAASTAIYFRLNPPTLAPAAGTTGLAYAFGYSANSNPWVPCDKVTACGVTASSVTMGGTAQRPIFNLNYTNLPAGCRVNIEASILDTASNSSTPRFTNGNGGSPEAINNSISISSWDVPYPTCGTPCGTCGFNCGPVTYFRCGGCP